MDLATSTNIYFNRPNLIKVPIKESIKMCAETGYRVIDLNFLDATTFKTEFITDDWEKWLDEILEVVERYQVEIRQAHAPVFNFIKADPVSIEKHKQLMQRSIECSKQLGVKWLVCHPETAYSAEGVKDSLEENYRFYSEMNELAEKANVGLALENMWEYNIAPKRKFATTVEELLQLIGKLNSKNIGVCWDFVHGAIMQQDQQSALRLVGDKLKVIHVSDYIGTGLEANHLLPFDGDMEWEPLMNTLREINYKGDMTYEIHRFTQNIPDELIRDVLKYSIKVGNYLISMFNQEELHGKN